MYNAKKVVDPAKDDKLPDKDVFVPVFKLFAALDVALLATGHSNTSN
jgi:hypothetical protein